MAKKVLVLPTNGMIELRFKGILSWEGLYQLTRGWLDEHKYDYMEKKYKDKAATVFGREVEVEMRPELKVNEFYKLHIDISWKIYDFKEFEAEIDGEKQLVTDGRFWVRFVPWVEFDYSGKFSSEFQKKLLDLLVDKILLRFYENKVYGVLVHDTYDLHAKIKSFLKDKTEFNAY